MHPFFISFLSVLFPPRCISCNIRIDNPEFVCCAPCTGKIILNSSFFCPFCGARIPPGEKACHADAGYLLGAATSFEQKQIRDLVHSLKYNGTRDTAPFIAHMMFEYMRRILPVNALDFSNYMLIPIPLHKRKERVRGYNQSSVLAHELKKIFVSLDLPFPEIRKDILMRKKYTPSQTECRTTQERRKNIAECFSVSHPEYINGKNIILIDDVHTTGATMGEAVRILKRCGGKRILGFVFAKT